MREKWEGGEREGGERKEKRSGERRKQGGERERERERFHFGIRAKNQGQRSPCPSADVVSGQKVSSQTS